MSEYQYLDLLDECRDVGEYREGRNGGTYGLFGTQMRFPLAAGFPLLTTKRLHWKSIAVELLWFLRGSGNATWMEDQGVTIWNEWGDPETRDLGPVYPVQWRNWDTGNDKRFVGTQKAANGEWCYGYFENRRIDQIAQVIESLRNDPYSRRHIVTAWNPTDLPQMALPPCHCLFQFFVSNGELSCQLYQRSADVFLGVPYNIASYALLTHLIAAEVGLEVGDFVHTLGDYHLYANHVEQAGLQVTRHPRSFPKLRIDRSRGQSVLDGTYEWTDFTLEGYDPHPAIKAEVSA